MTTSISSVVLKLQVALGLPVNSNQSLDELIALIRDQTRELRMLHDRATSALPGNDSDDDPARGDPMGFMDKIKDWLGLKEHPTGTTTTETIPTSAAPKSAQTTPPPGPTGDIAPPVPQHDPALGTTIDPTGRQHWEPDAPHPNRPLHSREPYPDPDPGPPEPPPRAPDPGAGF